MTGNGTLKKKIATKAAAASATMTPVLERLRPIRTTACEHDREHGGLEAEEQGRDDARPCRRAA